MEESKRTSTSKTNQETLEDEVVVVDDEHPDYIGGSISEEFSDEGDMEAEDAAEIHDEFTPNPMGPLPGPIGPIPRPGMPFPRPGVPTIPGPIIPRPFPFPGFCGAVSGKYRYTPFVITRAPRPSLPGPIGRPIIPAPAPGPIFPINRLSIKVRVDVDRFFPQQRISIQVTRTFPRRTAHAIAEVVSDTCYSWNRRTVRANIVFRDGDASLIPGTTVTFTARRTTGFNYSQYRMILSGGITPRTYRLAFESRYFDPVEFEVDRVANAGPAVTSYNTGTHSNRPSGMPNETLSLATVYQRAGFDVSMSPHSSIIPTSGAGGNGTWSDAEMHNAMVTYWSRFANRPKWAMWILYAARHDMGRGLGGIMFDDIGPNHRQGTAIFNDSFIQDVPAGDPNPAAWRRRMAFWTAIHEMGHGFNLAHAWQKSLGNPWIPLANEPEARSFMNYPFRVTGGQSSFFSNFRFRFSDDELVFMRHAPRRFVQMGNSNWFDNHGFEAPDELEHTGRWAFEIRPNRDSNSYSFLEPVNMELKLTNTSDVGVMIDDDMMSDGGHFTLYLQREGGETKQWKPMATKCSDDHDDKLDPGESIYGSHMISASTDGWIIDEPGFYKVQAAVNMGDEIVVSNVLRVYVAPPATHEEASIAADYFTEDVGRVIEFGGAPELSKAHDVLERVREACPDNPAAIHASVALTSPELRNFKTLDASDGREGLAIKTQKAKVSAGAKAQISALVKDSKAAANTLGHIQYFEQLRAVSEAMEDHGDDKGAVVLMSKTIDIMKERNILSSVIDLANRRLKRRK